MSILMSFAPSYFRRNRIPVSSIPKSIQGAFKSIPAQPLQYAKNSAAGVGSGLAVVAGAPWGIASWVSKNLNFKRAFAAIGVTTGGLLFWQGHNFQKQINKIIDATAPNLKKNATVKDLINYLGIK